MSKSVSVEVEVCTTGVSSINANPVSLVTSNDAEIVPNSLEFFVAFGTSANTPTCNLESFAFGPDFNHDALAASVLDWDLSTHYDACLFSERFKFMYYNLIPNRKFK